MNVIHQFLVHADDVYFSGENLNIIKNFYYLIASKEVGVEVNAEKTIYRLMFMSRQQATGQTIYKGR
jgi:hypothetical protein